MSAEDRGFLGRWARLKAQAREAEAAPPDDGEAVPSDDGEAVPSDDGEAVLSDRGEAVLSDHGEACTEVPGEVFDPESLPPLESLGADSDYTAFLAKGVPKALKHAALRRAWLTDPAIRNYKTMADYDWDFNAPGYGQLLPGDDPRKLVEAMFRHLRTEPEDAPDPEAREVAGDGDGVEPKEVGATDGEADEPVSS